MRSKHRDFWENKGRYKRHLDREFGTNGNGQPYWVPLSKYGEKYPRDLKVEKQRVKEGVGESEGLVKSQSMAAPSTTSPAPNFQEG